jgi:hypothetical protein
VPWSAGDGSTKTGTAGADTCHHRPVLIRGGVGLGVILTAVWVYCLLDAIMADEHRVRNLPKTAWVVIVLFTFEVGAIAWLVAGRPQGPARSLPYKGNAGYPEYDRPGRFAATNPDDDAEFLRKVRERAEAQRQEAKRQRAEREAAEDRAVEQERERRLQRERPDESTDPQPG